MLKQFWKFDIISIKKKVTASKSEIVFSYFLQYLEFFQTKASFFGPLRDSNEKMLFLTDPYLHHTKFWAKSFLPSILLASWLEMTLKWFAIQRNYFQGRKLKTSTYYFYAWRHKIPRRWFESYLMLIIYMLKTATKLLFITIQKITWLRKFKSFRKSRKLRKWRARIQMP